MLKRIFSWPTMLGLSISVVTFLTPQIVLGPATIDFSYMAEITDTPNLEEWVALWKVAAIIILFGALLLMGVSIFKCRGVSRYRVIKMMKWGVYRSIALLIAGTLSLIALCQILALYIHMSTVTVSELFGVGGSDASIDEALGVAVNTVNGDIIFITNIEVTTVSALIATLIIRVVITMGMYVRWSSFKMYFHPLVRPHLYEVEEVKCQKKWLIKKLAGCLLLVFALGIFEVYKFLSVYLLESKIAIILFGILAAVLVIMSIVVGAHRLSTKPIKHYKMLIDIE